MAEQEWTEAGVSSSDLTQLTSRLTSPRNVQKSRQTRQFYALPRCKIEIKSLKGSNMGVARALFLA